MMIKRIVVEITADGSGRRAHKNTQTHTQNTIISRIFTIALTVACCFGLTSMSMMKYLLHLMLMYTNMYKT